LADVREAQEILEALGMPPAQHNRVAGMTLIALCGLTPKANRSTAERRRCTVTKGIMDYLKEHYEADYAPNTRETFRRQVLHHFVQAGIADYNPYKPRLATRFRHESAFIYFFSIMTLENSPSLCWRDRLHKPGSGVPRYNRSCRE